MKAKVGDKIVLTEKFDIAFKRYDVFPQLPSDSILTVFSVSACVKANLSGKSNSYEQYVSLNEYEYEQYIVLNEYETNKLIIPKSKLLEEGIAPIKSTLLILNT